MELFSFSVQIYIFLLCIAIALSTHIERRQELFLKAFDSFSSEEDASTNFYTHKPIRTNRHGHLVDYVYLNSFPFVENYNHSQRIGAARNAADKLDPSTATEDGNHEVFLDLGHVLGSPMSGLKLHLKRNYKLVSRSYVVEERSRRGKIVKQHNLVDDCHYTGVIHNHRSFSKVALSLCNGLQGIIHKDDDLFFIEPLWNHPKVKNASETLTTSSPINDISINEESHPHVIIKRSALQHLRARRKNKDDLGHCGYADKFFGAAPWWRIDPREKERNDEKKEQEIPFDINKENKLRKSPRRHHHQKFIHYPEDHDDVAKKEAERKKEDMNIEHVRQKRSVSRERNVETLIVADKTLVGYHGRQEVEKYILTIMNIVASLYHDASVGNAVNVIVTRIILLTEDQPDLQITHHGDQTLDSFCKWQSGININESSAISDSGLAHHDNAVLLTGYDICTYKDEPCGTLGLAPVAGMCEPDRSCNINEDTGLSSAFTIAHEMGHNFGMQHDGNGNVCGTESGAPSQIMAAQLTKNASPFTWSRCSKNYITKFLDSLTASCLLDNPPLRDFDFPEELPGQMHGADEQCRFQYGAQSRRCKIGNTCRELWCLTKNDRCVTNSVPAAEGTNCSTSTIIRGWCYRGSCVRFGYRAEGVDGSWGGWTLWSQCSRTCGGGASHSSRSCNNPPPEHGGKYCIGARMRYRLCNAKPCPSPAGDFRTEQCQRFDTEPFRGKYYNWLPFDGGDQVNPCVLNCLAYGYNFYTEKAASVVDGTKCSSNSLDVCIRGECHHVGCDLQLHSEAVEDKCRVCGGDGSTCQTESGVFNEAVEHGRYHDVVTIPRGSVNIFVEELEMSTDNYIALRSVDNVEYINGGWTIDWPRKFDIAGATFNYERPTNEPESLHALGPTTIDLVLMVYLQAENRGIKYEYNVPLEREGSGGAESAFLWDHDGWTFCSATCAGGTQRRSVLCKRVDDDTFVQHKYCDPNTMPLEKEQACNVVPCPPIWKTGAWTDCSRTCGGGHFTRTVVCIRKMTHHEDEVIDNQYCTDDKPRASGECGMDDCPPEWISGRWSSCKGTCGVGYRTREVRCMSSDRRISLDEKRCNAVMKPSSRVQCNNGECPPPRWQYGKWGPCSVKCGRGLRRRRVICIDPRTNSYSNECSLSSKPRTTQSCESSCNTRPSSSKTCVDDPFTSYCPLVKKFRFCDRVYFRSRCCKTCST